ncbi:MAG: nucleotide-binding protein [Myxococcales bacterium]|nr:nucleotide-binding protein [Myxococcales bacterium]
MTTKPLVFLGSSSEGIKVAEVIESHLSRDFEMKRWDRGLFVPGHYALESLEEAARQCKFAVIVGTADDVLTKRRKTSRTIRDNLIFEFGLFYGVFGRKRTILVTPKRVALGLPTDLDGLTRATYTKYPGPPTTKKWLESLQAVSNEVTMALLKEVSAERTASARRAKGDRMNRRRQAALRLYRAVTTLRDIFIDVPTKALGAAGNKVKFDKVKADASAKVRKLEEDWQGDAELLGVIPQLSGLTTATSKALVAFPYPAVNVSQAEAHEVAGRFLARVSKGTVGERLGAAADQVGREAERKVTEFSKMYTDWWREHEPPLRQRAQALQDGVMNATFEGS